MKQIRVLVVDDSAVVRQVLSGLLNREPDITVTHAVADPILASERMRLQWPDVIVLDVEMPRMDGITFLRKIMAERPTPVVICSSLSENGARTSMDALAAGAVAVITKPRLDLYKSPGEGGDELLAAVRSAAQAKVETVAQRVVPAPPAPSERLSADAILAAAQGERIPSSAGRIIALGTSTGGTQALERVLTALTPQAAGIVVVQHMPEQFTAAFADRLDKLCQVRVREARHNDTLTPGTVLIAPGGRHMLLHRTGARYYVEVVEGPLVNRHRPSVDVLFRSVANSAGPNALGVIMTGMGDDGAAGLLEMRQVGARTLAQDEPSCVVYGMPREAVRRGAVERSVALDAIAREILSYSASA
ncbi:protein-glutamate methylesterase/protein-glutamine glutaminase [Pseudoduganella sp. RAF53_2]|uniref:protein-glutamate methylesterase/protein-glutamine glutaminase n=1 Tax=unclassified Pseudoduganella TaxID=2637179 RepID=UPI003F9D364C